MKTRSFRYYLVLQQVSGTVIYSENHMFMSDFEANFVKPSIEIYSSLCY